MRALFVDDENYLLELMKRYFELFKIPLETFHNGASALESLEKGSYELVILDYNLPGFDIHHFIERVFDYYSESKVLITSGEEEEFIDLEMDKGGPLFFLKKPFTINELAARLNELFPQLNLPF